MCGFGGDEEKNWYVLNDTFKSFLYSSFFVLLKRPELFIEQPKYLYSFISRISLSYR